MASSASSSSSSSSRFIAIFCMVLLLSLFFSAIACEARRVPSNPMEVGHVDVINDSEAAEKFMVEESCEGVGEEECLMRRTLVAHTDYIYTQKQKP